MAANPRSSLVFDFPDPTPHFDLGPVGRGAGRGGTTPELAPSGRHEGRKGVRCGTGRTGGRPRSPGSAGTATTGSLSPLPPCPAPSFRTTLSYGSAYVSEVSEFSFDRVTVATGECLEAGGGPGADVPDAAFLPFLPEDGAECHERGDPDETLRHGAEGARRAGPRAPAPPPEDDEARGRGRADEERQGDARSAATEVSALDTVAELGVIERLRNENEALRRELERASPRSAKSSRAATQASLKVEHLLLRDEVARAPHGPRRSPTRRGAAGGVGRLPRGTPAFDDVVDFDAPQFDPWIDDVVDFDGESVATPPSLRQDVHRGRVDYVAATCALTQDACWNIASAGYRAVSAARERNAGRRRGKGATGCGGSPSARPLGC